MYIIHHMKVTFFTPIVLPFTLLFCVNFHVINWFGGNFKHFRETKGRLKKGTFVSWFTSRSISYRFPRPPDVSLNWRMEKKLCIIMLVSSRPDGVLHDPVGGVSQQLLKYRVRNSPSDTACTVAFFIMELNCIIDHWWLHLWGLILLIQAVQKSLLKR